MLAVAVVVAFFICWAPFHAQRLLAIYAMHSETLQKSESFLKGYNVLTYMSGVLYYLGTTINPLLYNIMSHKFREAFKVCFVYIKSVTVTFSINVRIVYSASMEMIYL